MDKPIDIEAIRKRAEAATPGPWEAFIDDGMAVVHQKERGSICFGTTPEGGPDIDDARFCAHAREDVPALCSKLDKALEILSEAREMLGVLEDHGGHDGLGGKGYLAVLDHIDEFKSSLAALGVSGTEGK